MPLQELQHLFLPRKFVHTLPPFFLLVATSCPATCPGNAVHNRVPCEVAIPIDVRGADAWEALLAHPLQTLHLHEPTAISVAVRRGEMPGCRCRTARRQRTRRGWERACREADAAAAARQMQLPRMRLTPTLASNQVFDEHVDSAALDVLACPKVQQHMHYPVLLWQRVQETPLLWIFRETRHLRCGHATMGATFQDPRASALGIDRTK
mmetsp:Transcript_143294/g.458190  ORF Transcript_143294/g.458190 Transcript_143294/m.458190 type:complete len:209 (-) Transcript_143294:8-634(-)